MLLFWIIVFIASLTLLVKGSDWLIVSAEKIGLAIGLSPFIVGVTIVGVGTSCPELISSFAAAWRGVTDVVAANAIGSNIANILLIVGLSAIIGGRLTVSKSLIDLDLPLLAISTVLLLGIAWDKQITFGESLLMIATYAVYLLYTVLQKDSETVEEVEGVSGVLPSRQSRRHHLVSQPSQQSVKPKLTIKDFILLITGIIGLIIGAKYLIDSLINLSEILNVGTGVIAITAVAFGTSLPELLVSVRAAWQRKSDVALGNIFGSNVFNALVVIGLPGMFFDLKLDEQTFAIGLPAVGLATLLFVFSGTSKRIHMWEGAFFLSLYILFLAKLFNWF